MSCNKYFIRRQILCLVSDEEKWTDSVSDAGRAERLDQTMSSI